MVSIAVREGGRAKMLGLGDTLFVALPETSASAFARTLSMCEEVEELSRRSLSLSLSLSLCLSLSFTQIALKNEWP